MDDTVLGLVPKEVSRLFAGYTQDIRTELTLLKLYNPKEYKKRLEEQLEWQSKVREEALSPKRQETVDLGDVDPSGEIFYNIDWRLVYEKFEDFADNAEFALGVPIDEPDYIKVFELLSFKSSYEKYVLLRRAIENGFNKTLEYICIESRNIREEVYLRSDLWTIFRTEAEKYSIIIKLVVLELNKQNYSEADKHIAQIDENSIAFSIIVAVQRRFYSTIRLLSLQEECYSTLLYVFDKVFIVEYYKRYYNLVVRDESLYVLVATMAYINTAERYIERCNAAIAALEYVKNQTREYLIKSLRYSVTSNETNPHNMYESVRGLRQEDRYLLYSYLVLNGAPITEKNYLVLAITRWGYDALKVVDSKRFTDIMTYKKSAKSIVNAVYTRSRLEDDREELLYMIDYMLLADKRKRKNEGRAYTWLYRQLKKVDRSVAKYLKDRLDEM